MIRPRPRMCPSDRRPVTTGRPELRHPGRSPSCPRTNCARRPVRWASAEAASTSGTIWREIHESRLFPSTPGDDLTGNQTGVDDRLKPSRPDARGPAARGPHRRPRRRGRASGRRAPRSRRPCAWPRTARSPSRGSPRGPAPDARRRWNASWVTSSPKKPSTPSRMISARPPTRRAMTGVPQASASIATRPNGSGHDPGIRTADSARRARPGRRRRARRGTRPSGPARFRAGSKTSVWNSCSLGVGPNFRRDLQRSPGGLRDLDRVDDALLRRHPANSSKTRLSERRRSNGPSRVSPLWTIVHGTFGWAEACDPLIATTPIKIVGEGATRPGHVQTSVEGRDERPRDRPPEGDGIPLEMAVDDVERGLIVEHPEHRRVPADVAAFARGPERLRNGRDETDPGTSESPEANVVTSWPRWVSSRTSSKTTRSVPP